VITLVVVILAGIVGYYIGYTDAEIKHLTHETDSALNRINRALDEGEK
jgi:hypothetical protein